MLWNCIFIIPDIYLNTENEFFVSFLSRVKNIQILNFFRLLRRGIDEPTIENGLRFKSTGKNSRLEIEL